MRSSYLEQNSGLSDVASKGFEVVDAITLTAGQSGSCFYLDSDGGAYTITLPSEAVGLNYKFFVKEDTPTGAITIASGSANVYGNLEQQSDTNENNRVAAAGVTNVIIGTAALKGDYLEYNCDGASWYVSGMSSIQTAVSTS